MSVAARKSATEKAQKPAPVAAKQPVREIIPPHGGKLIMWQPGQSGNPGGRSKLEAEMMRRCREAGPEAADFLIAVMKDEVVGKDGKDEPATLRERIVATGMIMDRGFGKPRDTSPGDKNPVRPDLSSLSSSDIGALKKIFGKMSYRQEEE